MQWIQPKVPALVLAPMEGVTDAPMRAYLTARSGLSFSVSEFLRVNAELSPARVFRRHVPECENGWTTFSGVPVQLQLLGGNPERLAGSALRAVRLGATAIDLNFGCPAPTVNRHDGGASLLKCPDRIEAIVAAVRAAVPPELPVSAKLRLGWADTNEIFATAPRAEAGGASWITIHARTRMQGYTRPVYWEKIAEIRKKLSVPVVANGDIWSAADFEQCRAITGCEHFMLGRGAVADPELVPWIASHLNHAGANPSSAPECSTDEKIWHARLSEMVELMKRYEYEPYRIPARIKQWLKLVQLRRSLPWFDEVKLLKHESEILEALR